MNEKNDIYRELQKHLDKMPVGFPPTDSGVEIRILKRFFTPEEAEIATKLSFIPESLDNISKRLEPLGFSAEDIETALDRMVSKGAINGGKNPKTGEKYFSNALLAVGIFEYQVGRLTKDFVEDFEQYLDEAFKYEFTKTSTPQLRTIPIEQSIKVEHFVQSYDHVIHLIESRNLISVSNCVCRESKKILGKGCSHIMETCFQFGGAARHYIDHGLGRQISKDEALRIIEQSQKEGLVLQPGNSKKPFAICCCCSCCCEVLITAKKFPKPAQFFATNHLSGVDAEIYTGCEACIEICPMEAMDMVDGISHVNPERCIGCGVCVPSCSVDAITLIKKDKEKEPPNSTVEMFMRIMEEKNRQNQTKL